jgi:hypothetical protein
MRRSCASFHHPRASTQVGAADLGARPEDLGPTDDTDSDPGHEEGLETYVPCL